MMFALNAMLLQLAVLFYADRYARYKQLEENMAIIGVWVPHSFVILKKHPGGPLFLDHQGVLCRLFLTAVNQNLSKDLLQILFWCADRRNIIVFNKIIQYIRRNKRWE